MDKINIVKETTDLGNYTQENVSKIGKIAIEGMKESGKFDKFCEKLGIAKEDLTINTPALYTTAITSFIEKRLRPDLVAAQVIKVINNFNTKGQNALKVPLRSSLITAQDLPDSGLLSDATGTYGSTTITLTYKYAANTITHEIMKFANADLIAEEMGEIGDALGRKVDSDIIAALKVATTSAQGNSNWTGTGTSISVSYDILVDGLNSAKQNYAKPDVLLINPSTMATILKLDEFAGGTSITGALVFKGDDKTAFPIPMRILNMRVIESLQVDDDDIYLIDSPRTGYLVRAGDVETFDGRVSGYLAYEVIGALNYGVSIVQPKAVYRVEENVAGAP